MCIFKTSIAASMLKGNGKKRIAVFLSTLESLSIFTGLLPLAFPVKYRYNTF